MRVCASLSYALFASCSLARLLTPTPAVSDPTITAAPEVPLELFRKQNDNRFIGWISLLGTWSSRTCNPGYTYYQAGSVWRCCSTSSPGCNVPVGCVSGSLIFRLQTSGTQTATLTSIACTSGVTNPTDLSLSVCNTGLLYESAEAAGTDARTNIFCGANSLLFSYYRARPADSTSSPRPSSTPQSTPASTTKVPSPTPPPPPPPEKQSQAWIAGAVVGPIVGLALAGAILFFLLRRHRNNAPATAPPMQQHSHPNGEGTTAYDDTQQKPNLAPYGVGSHASTSPTQQPQNLYGAAPATQQWMPQQGQQTYPPPPPSSTSPPLQQQQQPFYGAQERPFSAELDGGTYQGVGGAAAGSQSPPPGHIR